MPGRQHDAGPVGSETIDRFRTRARVFVRNEVTPHLAAWEAAGGVDRRLFERAGEEGLLCLDGPRRFGGGGAASFARARVLSEELHAAGDAGAAWALVTHSDICAPYLWQLGSEEQQGRWLAEVCAGRAVLAIAMTEPGTGSDLASITTRAERHGDRYVVNGTKTFISNGRNADLIIAAVKTDPTERHRGISLLVLEAPAPGLDQSTVLSKVGLRTQDTAVVHLADVEVPVANRLGGEGEGFVLMMRNLPRERLAMAVAGHALARAALDHTVDRLRSERSRSDPGQHVRFRLAELATALTLSASFVDRCVAAFDAGRLSAVDAAMAKWWCTETAKTVTEECHQLVADPADGRLRRLANDARVQTIYGGTTEIMKEIVGRDLGF